MVLVTLILNPGNSGITILDKPKTPRPKPPKGQGGINNENNQ